MPQDLFPIPSLPPSRLSPSVWPGISPSSTETLLNTLKDNHEKWHVYFDRIGLHNHSSHYALALWSLGADESILKAAYEFDCAYQLPAFISPEPITVQNFSEHLGDDGFYNAYLRFFSEVVESKGITATLEEYVFDPKMNFDTTRGVGKDQPKMLSRFFGGLIHPMIHAGYGFEFGLPGMVVEGLASAAVHGAESSALLPPSFFESRTRSTVESLTSRTFTTLSLDNGKNRVPSSTDVHVFTILARMIKDSRLNPGASDGILEMYVDTVYKHGDILNKYANGWTIDISKPKEIERKIEELAWMGAVIYGIGGWKKGEEFNADFVHMHLVTSSLFLSSIIVNLKPTSQELLLRGYLVICLAWWVSNGRPGFDIAGFFAEGTAYLKPSGPLPTPHVKALPSPSSTSAVTPNPWLPIIETAIVHPDDHLPKLQRALAHYGVLYGTRPPGLADFSNTELPHADKLDGTLFIRAAGLTAKRLGRIREGEGLLSFWDRCGFYVESPNTELPHANGTAGSTVKRMARTRKGEDPVNFWERHGFYRQSKE